MPIELHLQVSEDFLNNNRIQEVLPPFLNLVGQDMYANLIKHSPVKEGRLKGAWNRERGPGGAGTLIFQNATYYAIFQNDGTYSYGPLHRKPKTKEVGGIKPKRFVEKSIEETGSRLQEFLNIAVSQID